MTRMSGAVLSLAALLTGCGGPSADSQPPDAHDAGGPVATSLTNARAMDGSYVSWTEHIIDDEAIGGVPIRGGDGLVLADLDLDSFVDVVSVHESDTQYDGVPDGHVRIAFGTGSADRWELTTLAEGKEAGAAEDVAVGDMNGDGYPDVVAACELGHLIYFQNPGEDARTDRWERLIPSIVTGRGSFIRVFLPDLNGDKQPEVVTANKGAQSPRRQGTELEPKPISWFEIVGPPLEDSAWVEHELTRIPWPINAQPVDLDGDGDLDVLGGSVAERRIFWFENVSRQSAIAFQEHPIEINGTSVTGDERPEPERDNDRALVTGFNADFVDLSGDGRLDIILVEAGRALVWLEQPADRMGVWNLHVIGSYGPDQLVGFVVADINGSGRPDVITGGYSRGPRDVDGEVTLNDPLGRLAWFENPASPELEWTRHDISRRKRGMFDKFVPRDMDGDGDVDFVSTRGNSAEFDGVFWLEQVRTAEPVQSFNPAREQDSQEMGLPSGT